MVYGRSLRTTGANINHGVPWPKCGEMELYEARTGPQNETTCPEASVPTVAGDNCFIATCHYANADGSANYNCGQRDYPKCLCDGYHTYGMLWDSLHVEHYFDDTLFWGPNFPTDDPPPSINQATNEVAFHSPFYWILTLRWVALIKEAMSPIPFSRRGWTSIM